MAASVAAHWYQQELGTPRSEEAHTRFPFLRMPYKRSKHTNTGPKSPDASSRPTTSRSTRSFNDQRPTTSRSHSAPSSKIVRRQSFSVHSAHSPSSSRTIVIMSSPVKPSRVQNWRKKFNIPSLAYYGWGTLEDVKAEAARSKPVTSVPPNVRTATTDLGDDLIDEAQADDMVLLTEMRAPSAMAAHQSFGGLTLVDSRLSSHEEQQDWSWVRIDEGN